VATERTSAKGLSRPQSLSTLRGRPGAPARMSPEVLTPDHEIAQNDRCPALGEHLSAQGDREVLTDHIRTHARSPTAVVIGSLVFELFRGCLVSDRAPTTDTTTTDPVKARHHALWALGDYDRIAALLGDLGRDLVAAADIRTGQRVLDVAAGTGNATYAGQGDDAEHVAALDRDLLEFAARENSGVVGEPSRYEFEYLLVVARKAPEGR
jgi:hypothetical protein